MSDDVMLTLSRPSAEWWKGKLQGMVHGEWGSDRQSLIDSIDKAQPTMADDREVSMMLNPRVKGLSFHMMDSFLADLVTDLRGRKATEVPDDLKPELSFMQSILQRVGFSGGVIFRNGQWSQYRNEMKTDASLIEEQRKIEGSPK